MSSKVDVFIGIAGAVHGQWSCGMYPFNVATCSSYELQVSNPYLQGIAGHRFGTHMYSMKSWSAGINCYASCFVYRVHASTISGEDYSFGYPHGHYQLLAAADQVSLLQ